jgi:hypothetical protein
MTCRSQHETDGCVIQHTLANPILVLSNVCEYESRSEISIQPFLIRLIVDDPITPSAAGKKMSGLFGNMSRHVISESYGSFFPPEHSPSLHNLTNTKFTGHSYLAWPQTCWSKVLTSYFEDGVLPKDGHFCPAEKESNIFLHYKR